MSSAGHFASSCKVRTFLKAIFRWCFMRSSAALQPITNISAYLSWGM